MARAPQPDMKVVDFTEARRRQFAEPRRKAAEALGWPADAAPSQILQERWMRLFIDTVNDLGLSEEEALAALRIHLCETVKATMGEGPFGLALDSFVERVRVFARHAMDALDGSYREDVDWDAFERECDELDAAGR